MKSANVKGKFANPKNIFENIDFYFMPSYSISIDTWENYIKNKEEIREIRKHEFGHQNIEQFTLFHYIRQEDRLAYFKQNETSRSSTIENLLGVDAERKKQKRIQEKSRTVDKLYKQLDTEIKNKKARLVENDNKTENKIEYSPLLNGKQLWDMETVFLQIQIRKTFCYSIIVNLIKLKNMFNMQTFILHILLLENLWMFRKI